MEVDFVVARWAFPGAFGVGNQNGCVLGGAFGGQGPEGVALFIGTGIRGAREFTVRSGDEVPPDEVPRKREGVRRMGRSGPFGDVFGVLRHIVSDAVGESFDEAACGRRESGEGFKRGRFVGPEMLGKVGVDLVRAVDGGPGPGGGEVVFE